MRFPGGKFRAFTISYDDAVGTDLRLMEIMRKNGIKGTFNACSGIPDDPDYNIDVEKTPTAKFTLPQIAEYYKDFEIATHGMTHSFFRDLPATTVVYETMKDREVFEKMFSKRILGHAYPNGSYNKETIAALRACGIIYGRITGGSHSFSIPEDWMEYQPTCAHTDKTLNELCDKFLAEPASYRAPYLFTLYGHSYQFENDNNWYVIEDFLAKIGGKDNVWYAGLGEIVEYVNAYRSLIYTVDTDLVYNPTALDIWIATGLNDHSAICIPSGATIKLC